MSNVVLESLLGQYRHGWGFFEEFCKTCPDAIWAESTGKFPAWQHVYHAAECVYFFFAPEQMPSRTPAYAQDVMMFKDLKQPACPKDKMSGILKEANKYAEKFFATLSDATLGNLHAGLSKRLGQPFTNAGVIGCAIGHNFYHFGNCDAALRTHGLEGLY